MDERAFSLLEVLVSILLSLLIVTVSTQFSISLWRATKQIQAIGDEAAARDNAARILAFDGHQAVSDQLSLGHLMLRTLSGAQYTYLTNGQHQFIRVQSGGGTVVIATGIITDTAAVSSNEFSECLRFADGSTEEVHVCTLKGLLSGVIGG